MRLSSNIVNNATNGRIGVGQSISCQRLLFGNNTLYMGASASQNSQVYQPPLSGSLPALSDNSQIPAGTKCPEPAMSMYGQYLRIPLERLIEIQPFPLSFSTVTAFSKPVIQELSMNQTGGNVDDLG
jgi:hypothetical protein